MSAEIDRWQLDKKTGASADLRQHQRRSIGICPRPTKDGRAIFWAHPLLLAALGYAACASSVTRSQVVARMLGRASIRSNHATRFACGAPSSAHSGVAVKKDTLGATRRSASDRAAPAKKGCWP